MRCDTTPPPCDCGSDVHARSMDVCLVRHDGAMLRHRNMQAAPAPLRQAGAPSRDGWVVAVEGLFTWDGLADLGAAAGLPGVLGPALSRPAMHGGQATNDKSDSPKSAALLRGGLRPPASVSPAERRAPRALRRRRPARLCTRPTARIPGPRSARRWPPKPTVQGAPRVVRRPPCQSPWRSPARASPRMLSGGTIVPS